MHRIVAVMAVVAVAVTTALADGAPVAAESGPRWVTPAVTAPGVELHTFDSPTIGERVSYHIYLPQEYRQEPTRRFPVLYWLHGTLGGLPGIRPLAKHFGDAMAAGQVPPMLVVFANGLRARMWVNSKDGSTPVQTIILEELIPHVDGDFRTIANAGGRMVEGFSSGGYGAMRFGLGHPEVFGAASSLSGGPLQRAFTFAPRVPERSRKRVLRDVYGGDHSYFTSISPWELAVANEARLPDGFPLRVVIGADDEMLAVNRRFHEHLDDLGIVHKFIILPGVGHDSRDVLQAMGADGWAFYRRALAPRSTLEK